jgi:hypothetical protein
MKDKSYRRYPLGEDVGRFLRALRVERRSLNTRESYETVLRRLVLDHRDFDALERFCEPDGYDLLIDFLDRWWGDSRRHDRSTRSRRQELLPLGEEDRPRPVQPRRGNQSPAW